MMSQPVSMATAPRLAAPRRNSRRDGSGSSLPASLIKSFGSTPGICLRWRDIIFSTGSAANDHRAQAFWHEDREQYVHSQESYDRCHRGEVHVARGIVAAEECREPPELHRLPDRYARKHDHTAGQQHTNIEKLLHRIINRKVVVRELAAQRGDKVTHHFARADRKQFASKATGPDADAYIENAVDHQEPHGGEMPQQRAREPFAERDLARKCKA